MATMNLHDFDLVLESCMLSWGIETTIRQIILPFVQKTGLLYSNDLKHKAALLLVEQTIKQKLTLGIEKAPADRYRQTVLFIVSKKANELSVLFLHYLVRQLELNAVLINCSSLNREVIDIVEAVKPDYIFSTVTDKASAGDASSFITHLTKHYPDTELIKLDAATVYQLTEQVMTITKKTELLEKLRSLQEENAISS